MPIKIIPADTAWKAGASWDTGPPLNTGSQVVITAINNSAGILYTGDVVISGTGVTTIDPTAVSVSGTTTAASPYTLGVVGGQTNMPGTGGSIPNQIATQRQDTVTTANGGTSVTDSSTLASDVGKGVSGPGIPSDALIVSVTAGASFVMSKAATASGTVTAFIGPRYSSIGPGYLNGAFPLGDLLPVVIAGLAYINVGQAAVAAGNVLSTGTTSRIAIVASTPTVGTNIAIALEDQNAGLPSGDGTNNKVV